MTIENGTGLRTTGSGVFFDDGRGGGILNYGTLTVSNCSVSGNNVSVGNVFGLQGGGIYNAGRLTVTNCSVSGNKVTSPVNTVEGGGIFNAGTMTLSGCSVTNNSATRLGGGIFNAGTLTILSSTVTGNTTYSGAGIYNDASGNLTIANKSLVCNNFDSSGVEDNLVNLGTVKISMSKVCKFSGNK
jgi:hypothetical protein